MTIPELIRAKNNILKQYIGLDFDLIPDDQIENVKKTKRLSIASARRSCPYCVELDHNCSICPMGKASNTCGQDRYNTFSRYETYVDKNNLRLHTDKKSSAYKPMKNLIREYNKAIKD